MKMVLFLLKATQKKSIWIPQYVKHDGTADGRLNSLPFRFMVVE